MPKTKSSTPSEIKPTTQFEISALQWALGATAIFSAIFYYICWVYQHRYFESFGLYPEIVGFTSPEYFLNAKSALAINTLIIGLLISIRFVINLESKWIRMTIAWSSVAGITGGLIYIINDMRVWWSAFGITVAAYRSIWILSSLVFALLAYGVIAPTFIYEKIHRSKNYQNLDYLAVWSSLGALALVLITLTTNFIGGLEGKHDVSTNSRSAY